jgi:hypothetical protein
MPLSYLQVKQNAQITFYERGDGLGRGARFSVLERVSTRSPKPWAKAHGRTLKRAPQSNQ